MQTRTEGASSWSLAHRGLYIWLIKEIKGDISRGKMEGPLTRTVFGKYKQNRQILKKRLRAVVPIKSYNSFLVQSSDKSGFSDFKIC